MLYRRGRPTSVVLLLLMIVSKLTLPLSRHSPLGLHHLLRLVGTARGLMPLRRVEVLQIRRWVRAAGVAEVGTGVRTRTWTRRHAAFLELRVSGLSMLGETISPGPSQANLPTPGNFVAGLGTGNHSRLFPGPPNILPLLTRLSMARSTSADHMFVSTRAASKKLVEVTADGSVQTCWVCGVYRHVPSIW